jgi:hypothetical protein
LDPLGLSRTPGTGSTVSDMSDAVRRQQAPLTVSQRLAATLGQPPPRPLSDTERAELERLQDQADAGAEVLYGVRGQAAA